MPHPVVPESAVKLWSAASDQKFMNLIPESVQRSCEANKQTALQVVQGLHRFYIFQRVRHPKATGANMPRVPVAQIGTIQSSVVFRLIRALTFGRKAAKQAGD